MILIHEICLGAQSPMSFTDAKNLPEENGPDASHYVAGLKIYELRGWAKPCNMCNSE